jgi:Putative effector of murein hydrolase LrgA
VALTGLPIPANILGIIVLFTLLCTGVVKERHIGQAANFFLKHLALFFVPIVVGLMVWGNLLYEYGLLMLLAIAVSSLLPLLAVAWLATRLSREKK